MPGEIIDIPPESAEVVHEPLSTEEIVSVAINGFADGARLGFWIGAIVAGSALGLRLAKLRHRRYRDL